MLLLLPANGGQRYDRKVSAVKAMLLAGTSDATIRFYDTCLGVKSLGFDTQVFARNRF